MCADHFRHPHSSLAKRRRTIHSGWTVTLPEQFGMRVGEIKCETDPHHIGSSVNQTSITLKSPGREGSGARISMNSRFNKKKAPDGTNIVRHDKIETKLGVNKGDRRLRACAGGSIRATLRKTAQRFPRIAAAHSSYRRVHLQTISGRKGNLFTRHRWNERSRNDPATWSGQRRPGSLLQFFNPPLTPKERETAAIEGWILGVV
jgi:hypothetical protein